MYLKRNSRFGQTTVWKTVGSLFETFLQTVIILAVLFGWTEMAFKDKRQPRAPYGEYRNDYNCLYLIINKTLFPADRRSSRSCKKQNAHFLVFTCLYMV